MLLNGIHLLPDGSGALIWPKQRLAAAVDPLCGGDRNPGAANAVVARLSAMLKRRRPETLVWIGDGLAHALTGGRLGQRDAADLARLVADLRWIWVGESLPEGLPGISAPEWSLAPLTFRASAQPGNPPGEISATFRPLATARDGDRVLTCPCYVLDGRRMVLPAFGPQPEGMDVCSPAAQSLFRRQFHVLMLSGGRLLSRSRGQLAKPVPDSPRPRAAASGRMQLFPSAD